MALPTGDITLGQVAAELGVSLPLTLGDSRVRALAGVASGPISLGQLRGKSAYTAPSLSTNDIAEGFTFAASGSNTSASASATITISGGEAPFSWSWSRISGSPTVNGGGNATLTAVTSGVAPFNRTATFRGTVTDNRGSQAWIDVPVSLAAGDSIS